MKYRIIFDYSLDCYCAEKKGWFRWSYVDGTIGDTALEAETILRTLIKADIIVNEFDV